MNTQTYSNPCIRCGSERIVSKRYEEAVETFRGGSKIVHIEKVCPNPECQKQLDAELNAQQKKKDDIRKRSEERALARRAKKDYDMTATE